MLTKAADKLEEIRQRRQGKVKAVVDPLVAGIMRSQAINAGREYVRYRDGRFAVHKGDEAESERLTVLGDGTQVKPYLHVSELIDAMTFIKPVTIGDVLCVYADIDRIGRTSISIHLEAWALRRVHGERVKVTEGLFTFVAIDDEGQPRPVHG